VTTPAHRLLDGGLRSALAEALHAHTDCPCYATPHTECGCDRTWRAADDVLRVLATHRPDADIRALPVEPGVGVTVEVVAGEYATERFRRSRGGGWRRDGSRGGWVWADLLQAVGPQGVRVLKGGESNG
jgi:hypothetical protein